MKNKSMDTPNKIKMTDEELSRIFGRYQRTESICLLLGVLCIIAGCILAVVKRDVIVLSALFFGGVALIFLLALPAQKKKKTLMQQQLGGYFRAELDRFFGAEPEIPTLPIDKSYLESAGLLLPSWKDCTVEGFREGTHQGLLFSAANVELSRTVEEKSGPTNENWMTRTETVFKGVVIRCKDIGSPSMDIVINDWMQKPTKCDLTDPEAFRQRFTAHTADGKEADALVTPELRALCQRFERAGAGRLCGLSLQDGALALALQTNYIFAGIPESLDVRDVTGVRKWFTATLQGMGQLLDILRESPALSQPDTEE